MSQPADPFNEGVAEALRLLEKRDLTRLELETKLVARFADLELVRQVIERLTQRGFLSEQRVEELLLRKRGGKRALGDARLSLEFEARGLVYHPEENPAPEIDRAIECLRGKYRELPEAAKAARYLSSRGFSEDTVEHVLENLENIFG